MLHSQYVITAHNYRCITLENYTHRSLFIVFGFTHTSYAFNAHERYYTNVYVTCVTMPCVYIQCVYCKLYLTVMYVNVFNVTENVPFRGHRVVGILTNTNQPDKRNYPVHLHVTDWGCTLYMYVYVWHLHNFFVLCYRVSCTNVKSNHVSNSVSRTVLLKYYVQRFTWDCTALCVLYTSFLKRTFPRRTCFFYVHQQNKHTQLCQYHIHIYNVLTYNNVMFFCFV